MVANPNDAGLSDSLKPGLVALGIIALVSAVTTASLFAFIAYRATKWHRFYLRDIGKNPFVLLLCNLFLADFFQALGFLFSFHWFAAGSIISKTGPCTTQGFLINFGDVASAFFVLTVAVQTWAHLRFQGQLRRSGVLAIIGCIWMFALALTVLGPVTSPNYFVNTGAWCWISDRYKNQRLAYHYFWIFLVELGTLVVYGFVIYELRRSSRKVQSESGGVIEDGHQQADETYRRIRKSCLIMCCYPISYIALTLPLAISRMYEIKSEESSQAFRIFCGAFLVSSGWVDSLLYVLTRASFLKSQGHSNSHPIHAFQPRGMEAQSAMPVSLPKNFSPGVPTYWSSLGRSGSMSDVKSDMRSEFATPQRARSTSSWNTSWSETKTLPRQHAEEPLSPLDNDIFSQTTGHSKHSVQQGALAGDSDGRFVVSQI